MRVRWWSVREVVRRNRAGTKRAREHLEQSIADRPEVEAITSALERQATANNFASRVDESLKGRK
jgi:hypothetical protein